MFEEGKQKVTLATCTKLKSTLDHTSNYQDKATSFNISGNLLVFSISKSLYQPCPCDGLTCLPIQPSVEQILATLVSPPLSITLNGFDEVVVKVEGQTQLLPVHFYCPDNPQLLVTNLQIVQLMKFRFATCREQLC